VDPAATGWATAASWASDLAAGACDAAEIARIMGRAGSGVMPTVIAMAIVSAMVSTVPVTTVMRDMAVSMMAVVMRVVMPTVGIIAVVWIVTVIRIVAVSVIGIVAVGRVAVNVNGLGDRFDVSRLRLSYNNGRLRLLVDRRRLLRHGCLRSNLGLGNSRAMIESGSNDFVGDFLLFQAKDFVSAEVEVAFGVFDIGEDDLLADFAAGEFEQRGRAVGDSRLRGLSLCCGSKARLNCGAVGNCSEKREKHRGGEARFHS